MDKPSANYEGQVVDAYLALQALDFFAGGAAVIGLLLLIEKVRIVAATDPDLIYQNDEGRRLCNYLPNANNRCGCIVGEALAEAGLPREKLAELDAAMLAPPGLAGGGWGDAAALRILDGLVTHQALTSPWLAFVQEMQDDGEPWADAVRRADNQALVNGWVMA
jgi:hypothetical protein